MTLKYLIKTLEDIALLQPNINSCGNGDIYNFINGNPQTKYSIFFVTQGTHREQNNIDYYNLNLFYLDRLTQDKKNNLRIQSTAKECLSNIIKSFCETFDVEVNNQINYTPFTETFSNDLCSGVFCNLTFEVMQETDCAEQYGDFIKPIIQVINNQNITITENGVYHADNGYSGFGEVKVEVEVDDYYNRGFEQGIAEQKALIQPITITENGTYTNENGYSPINVNIDTDSYYNNGYNEGYVQGESEGYNDGFSEGFDEGVVNGKEEQKALLESIKITENGVYDNENGFDVVNVEIDTQSYYDNGYNEGYVQGKVNGIEQGIAEQKSKIQPITITENGTYTNENGYSPINVNIDTDSYYNNGYNEGVVNGIAQGKEEQKSLLTSITITENGNYTNENGYNEVIVNVGGEIKPKLPNGITLQDSTFSTIDMSNWNWENVYDWGEMFADCVNLTEIQNFPTNVEILATARMFNNCNKLTSIPQFDTSKVINMKQMFSSCQSLTSLDLSSFDTSNVIDMSYMFYNSQFTTSLDLSSFDTSNVIDMRYMFADCTRLTSLDVSSFDTSNVINMSYMFNYCNNLVSLDLSSFDTSKVTNMYAMFSSCKSLTSLDLSSFNTSNVTDMRYMFSNCRKLTSISNIDISNITNNMAYMFNDCYKLKNITLKGKPSSGLSSIASSMFNNAGKDVTNPILYYPQEFANDYQKIINVLPSKWTAVPY